MKFRSRAASCIWSSREIGARKTKMDWQFSILGARERLLHHKFYTSLKICHNNIKLPKRNILSKVSRLGIFWPLWQAQLNSSNALEPQNTLSFRQNSPTSTAKIACYFYTTTYASRRHINPYEKSIIGEGGGKTAPSKQQLCHHELQHPPPPRTRNKTMMIQRYL